MMFVCLCNATIHRSPFICSWLKITKTQTHGVYVRCACIIRINIYIYIYVYIYWTVNLWNKAQGCISVKRHILPAIDMDLLPDTYNCGLRMHQECWERFPRHRLQWKQLSRHASRHVRHARVVMHVEIANPRWWGKRSRYSRCLRNPQFYVSSTRPM